MRRLILAAVLLNGCGSDDSGPITCSLSERSGTYLMSAEEVSGNCGPQTTGLVRLDPNADVAPCILTAPDVVRADQCTLERSAECPLDDIEPGAWLETVMISTQETDDGSRISGTMTFTLHAANNTALCTSTYRISAVRQ